MASLAQDAAARLIWWESIKLGFSTGVITPTADMSLAQVADAVVNDFKEPVATPFFEIETGSED